MVNKITGEILYKNGCWTCLKAQQDPTEKYTCPKLEQHWKDYELQQKYHGE